MRKILLVLSVGLLTTGCVFHRGVHRRHHALLKAAHYHGHACGHHFVNGVWIVVK
jgi:hypothetical protein